VKPLRKFGSTIYALVGSDVQLDVLRVSKADDLNRA
jgi:hypothetical protein